MMEEVSRCKKKTDHKAGFVLWLHGRWSCESKQTSMVLDITCFTWVGGC